MELIRTAFTFFSVSILHVASSTFDGYDFMLFRFNAIPSVHYVSTKSITKRNVLLGNATEKYL